MLADSRGEVAVGASCSRPAPASPARAAGADGAHRPGRRALWRRGRRATGRAAPACSRAHAGSSHGFTRHLHDHLSPGPFDGLHERAGHLRARRPRGRRGRASCRAESRRCAGSRWSSTSFARQRSTPSTIMTRRPTRGSSRPAPGRSPPGRLLALEQLDAPLPPRLRLGQRPQAGTALGDGAVVVAMDQVRARAWRSGIVGGRLSGPRSADDEVDELARHDDLLDDLAAVDVGADVGRPPGRAP